MRGYIKHIILILSSLILMFTLSGCDIVGDARSTHAYTQVKNGEASIIYGDIEYKLLPSNENLSPLATDYDNIIYVTEPDVPVLLSYFIGQPYAQSDDGIFLLGAYDTSDVYYCRADKYDDILKKLNGDFVATNLCYSYYSYNEDYDSYTETRTLLDSAESSAIESVLSTVEGTVIPEIANLDYDYLVEVYACSDDTLFMSHYIDILLKGSDYYLILYNEASTVSYKVPAAESDIISEIVNTVISADEFYYDYDYYEDEF